MKKMILLLLIGLSAKLSAQNTDYMVTMRGIGTIKVGMLKTELEKVLNKKITLHYLSDKDSGYADTVKTKYKNADVTLYLGKEYVDDNTTRIILTGVRTSSPLCKTKSGLGIGSDKMTIINAYETYWMEWGPDFEDDTYTKRSKTRATLIINDDDYTDNFGATALIFYFVNKKVVACEVTTFVGE